MNDKLVIISTINAENHEKSTLPFVIATAAQTADVNVSVFLQADAVVIAKIGEAEKVKAKGLMPLKELLDTFFNLGGKLYLCSPCVKERGISTDELIEGSELAAAGTLVDEVMAAQSVVTY